MGQQAGLTGATRDAFVGAAIRTCNARQLNARESASIAKPLLNSYCACYANGLADRMSENDLLANKSLTESEKLARMKPAIDAASSQCMAEVGETPQNRAK